MKVIDLFNKMANKQISKNSKYKFYDTNNEFYYNGYTFKYISDDKDVFKENSLTDYILCEEIEIIEEPKTKFNVGDQIMVKKDLKVGFDYANYMFIEPMKQCRGKKAKIIEVRKSIDGSIYYNIDISTYNFPAEMLELFEEPREDKLKGINKIQYYYKNTYGNISQHKKSEIDIIDKINEIIENQNKIIKVINANSNRK